MMQVDGLLGGRPEIFLSALMVVMTTLMMVVAVLTRALAPRSRFDDYEMSLRRILKDREVSKAIQENPAAAEQVIKKVLEAVPAPQQKTANTRGLFTKISEDITWDVAGLIGIGVTAVLLIMMVAGKKADIPDAILAGWTTILGFYFGKASVAKE